jgi:hypothetical protein
VTEAYAYEPEGPEAGAPEQDEAQTGADVTFLQRAIQSANLAADLDPSKLSEIGSKVCQEFKIDLATRVAEGWEERYKSAMDLALQVKEEKSYPWPKASNVKFPLMSRRRSSSTPRLSRADRRPGDRQGRREGRADPGEARPRRARRQAHVLPAP